MHAAVALLRAGYASEVFPLLRSAHENHRTLDALTDTRDTRQLEDWLKDHALPQQRLMRALDRFQRTIREEMRSAGLDELPQLTRHGIEQLYEFLSEYSHPRRSAIASTVSTELRLMPVGPHPDVLVRGVTVGYAGTIILETVSTVGFALVLIFGPALWRNRIQPTVDQLLQLFDTLPLTVDALKADIPPGATNST